MKYNELLPTDWYTCTIRQAREEEINGFPNLVLVFTIDRGEYAYRNILKKYPLNDTGMEKLSKDFQEMAHIVYTNYDSDYFWEQFTKNDLRAAIKVERTAQLHEIKNIITEFKIPKLKPDYNVKKPKSEDHYHAKNKGRKLPINKKPIE